MNNQIIYVTVIIILLILLLLIINRKNEIQNVISEGFETINTIKKYLKNNSSENDFTMENFVNTSNSWITSDTDNILEEEGLYKIQKKEINDMITKVTNTTLENLVVSQSPLFIGAMGPPGQKGPPGTNLIASGRLINKDGSFDSSDNSKSNPKYVIKMNDGGISENVTLSFTDKISNFESSQNWQLNVNDNLINRSNNSCLTMDSTNSNLSMADCTPSNNGQKWKWDKSNRIISKENSELCIALTNPQTNIPNCDLTKGKCTTTPNRYLTVRNCDLKNKKDDEIWDFYKI